MSCGELVLKSASTTFTGYFLIVSIAFILYGISASFYLLKVNSLDIIEREYVALPSLCLILFGLILLFLVIVGCCAICREIPCCTETYSIFLIVLALAQIGVGAFSLYHFQIENPKFAQQIYDSVTDMYLNYNNDPTQLDNTQEWLGCCGIDGPHNWSRDNRTIPSSCCSSEEIDCKIFSASCFSEGCSFMVFSYDSGTNYIIGWSLIIVAVTEIIAACLGISISCAFWRNSRIMWI